MNKALPLFLAGAVSLLGAPAFAHNNNAPKKPKKHKAHKAGPATTVYCGRDHGVDQVTAVVWESDKHLIASPLSGRNDSARDQIQIAPFTNTVKEYWSVMTEPYGRAPSMLKPEKNSLPMNDASVEEPLKVIMKDMIRVCHNAKGMKIVQIKRSELPDRDDKAFGQVCTALKF